jgi:hypothetical protein
MDYRYKIGEKVEFDLNYNGVNPKNHTGIIVNLDRTMATHGYPAAPAYKIRFDDNPDYIGAITENQIIRDFRITKMAAINKLPTNQKIWLAKIFDRFIRDYESESGIDADIWFDNHTADILTAIQYRGVELYRFVNIGQIIYKYYMAF